MAAITAAGLSSAEARNPNFERARKRVAQVQAVVRLEMKHDFAKKGSLRLG